MRHVESDQQKFFFKKIVNNYHSYKQQSNYVGRQVNCLIYCGEQVIGCIGFGSYMLPEPKALMDYIGWGKEQFNANFNKVANNWRFTLIKRGYGSRVLSLCHKEIPKLWKKLYGDKLVLLVTLVKKNYPGTTYKAGGWEYIGDTAGYGGKRHYRYNEYKEHKEKGGKPGMLSFISEDNKKKIFVKPLHRYWKRELLNITEPPTEDKLTLQKYV